MKFKNRGSRASKEGFSEGLLELGRKYDNVISLGADISASVGMDAFAKAFPERFFSLGIAEQNCIGVAAGLALSGKVPVFSTYGVFAGLRTTDQVRISLCYNNVHAIIGGAHAGLSVGPDGATHQALEDIAIMRVLPNMTILSPADATQARLATIAAYEQCNGPVYVRFGRAAFPDFTNRDGNFEVGKSQQMREGKDISIIATGHMVWEALLAAEKLKQHNIEARVINMYSIKPLDKNAILQAARETKAILTAEEHQITGGLGSAIAEVVVQNHPVKMAFVGMQDRFGESGEPGELMKKHGLTASSIIRKVKELL
ncbi:MAG: transketolase C-terminal domain-containing protein [Bacteroidota bacterium]|nr:transketolase C-terminal domain-containing protein [Bacteroidota bacterium]